MDNLVRINLMLFGVATERAVYGRWEGASGHLGDSRGVVKGGSAKSIETSRISTLPAYLLFV